MKQLNDFQQLAIRACQLKKIDFLDVFEEASDSVRGIDGPRFIKEKPGAN